MTTHIKKFLATYDAHLGQKMNDVQNELNRLEKELLKELDEWLAIQPASFRLITIIPTREASFDVNDENWVRLVVVYQASGDENDNDYDRGCADTRRDMRQIVLETIERCAQVADELAKWHSNPDIIACYQHAAATIRALKERP